MQQVSNAFMRKHIKSHWLAGSSLTESLSGFVFTSQEQSQCWFAIAKQSFSTLDYACLASGQASGKYSLLSNLLNSRKTKRV